TLSQIGQTASDAWIRRSKQCLLRLQVFFQKSLTIGIFALCHVTVSEITGKREIESALTLVLISSDCSLIQILRLGKFSLNAAQHAKVVADSCQMRIVRLHHSLGNIQ